MVRRAYQNPRGGLNARGRRAMPGHLKAPVRSGTNPRRISFAARFGHMKGPEARDGHKTRLGLALQAWGFRSKQQARLLQLVQTQVFPPVRWARVQVRITSRI